MGRGRGQSSLSLHTHQTGPLTAGPLSRGCSQFPQHTLPTDRGLWAYGRKCFRDPARVTLGELPLLWRSCLPTAGLEVPPAVASQLHYPPHLQPQTEMPSYPWNTVQQPLYYFGKNRPTYLCYLVLCGLHFKLLHLLENSFCLFSFDVDHF